MTYTILTAQNTVSLNRWENESTNTEQFNSILKDSCWSYTEEYNTFSTLKDNCTGVNYAKGTELIWQNRDID